MPVLHPSTVSITSQKPVLTGGPVIVASDGTSVSSDALFNAARLVSRVTGGDIALLGVSEPVLGVPGGSDVLPVPPELDEVRRAHLLDSLRREVSVSASGDLSWPIDVVVGSPAHTLAEEATRRGASMLVMGIGRHNPLDRLFGTEITLSTLRESRVPVFAVGPTFPTQPSRAVVGLDFSTASVQATHYALQMLQPGGHLTLVHVRPRFEHPSSEWQAWDADYGRTLPPLFEQVRAQLDIHDDITVETVTLRGDPAPALIAYAQQVNAELIAVGTQRHSLYERLMVGSVATKVMRTARASVLAVPERQS